MQSPSLTEIQSKIPRVVEQTPYLKLLVLFGSRATANDTENSDWDFAVLYDEELRHLYETEALDWLRIWSILQAEFKLSEQQIDVVILNQCSKISAHNVAETGLLLYESCPGEFQKFRASHLMSLSEKAAYIDDKRMEVRAALARWKR
ncbi:MAG: nucleotidyltransferase domain-containing protein [Spirulina sp.]